jgi:purine-binding chemotaxis protein CheW
MIPGRCGRRAEEAGMSTQTVREPAKLRDVSASRLLEGKDFLTFDLSGETFALEAILVREVLDKSPETNVPGAPGFVDAVANFRGRIIPLADLRLAFGLGTTEATQDSRIIVIEFDFEGEATLIGLRADKVFEVTTIAPDSTEPAPRLGTRWRPDFIRCLAKRAGEVIVLPDLARIFAVCGQPERAT